MTIARGHAYISHIATVVVVVGRDASSSWKVAACRPVRVLEFDVIEPGVVPTGGVLSSNYEAITISSSPASGGVITWWRQLGDQGYLGLIHAAARLFRWTEAVPRRPVEW